ncbi:UNVERIFIED_CONTAM: hypothetical protein Slati_3569900, partial [Sesamum latifolium]
ESVPTSLNEKVPSSDSRATSGDLLGRPQSGLGDLLKNSEHDALGEYPYIASRDSPSQTKLHQPDTRRQQNDLEPSANWTWKASEYPINLDDPNSSCSPYLPPVLEEPSSFFSEVADDDPPPAIEGLQISGEAFPGWQLQACGYSINGTTSCNFEWVRHLEDGSFNYIDGAKQPTYLVTADDVDTYLAIEVQPLDDRKRKFMALYRGSSFEADEVRLAKGNLLILQH